MNGNGGNNNSRNKGNAGNATKFCAVCHAAGRSGYDTHFVRADKFDRSSPITCPYLLSIECRRCGKTGHTSGYCPGNVADVTPVAPVHATRLPVVPPGAHIAPPPPRIVFPSLEKKQFESSFPALVGSKNPTTISIATVPRVQNDEPLLRRGPPEASEASEASPVHSPAIVYNKKKKNVYNKKNNAFGALAADSDSDSSADSPSPSPVAIRRRASSPAKVKKNTWASVASMADPNPPRRLVPLLPLARPSRLLAPLAPLAPLRPLPPVFKARSKETQGEIQKKKLWGDSDSEDDEEFLRRGLE